MGRQQYLLNAAVFADSSLAYAVFSKHPQFRQSTVAVGTLTCTVLFSQSLARHTIFSRGYANQRFRLAPGSVLGGLVVTGPSYANANAVPYTQTTVMLMQFFLTSRESHNPLAVSRSNTTNLFQVPQPCDPACTI